MGPCPKNFTGLTWGASNLANVFFQRRQKIERDQEAVNRGEDLWTAVLPVEARRKIEYAVRDLTYPDLGGFSCDEDAIGQARGLVLRDIGHPFLATATHDSEVDFFHSLLNSPEEVVYSQIEAVFSVVQRIERTRQRSDGRGPRAGAFERTVNTSLRESWVKCELVNGQIVEFDSLEMHTNVVVPALRLLSDDPLFQPSERAFKKAIREIQEGEPDDAITDAATAVQEMLVSLGAPKTTVSRGIKWAIGAGLLAPYDTNLGSWIEADRSGEGDAHNSKPTTVEDAWLTVHIAGALIVRLSKGTKRGPAAQQPTAEGRRRFT